MTIPAETSPTLLATNPFTTTQSLPSQSPWNHPESPWLPPLKIAPASRCHIKLQRDRGQRNLPRVSFRSPNEPIDPSLLYDQPFHMSKPSTYNKYNNVAYFYFVTLLYYDLLLDK